MPNADNILYRHFNAAGHLLYVGITSNLWPRQRDHLREAEWRDQITMITIERHENRETLQRAEIEAIAKEKPIYNKTYSVGLCEPPPEIHIITGTELRTIRKSLQLKQKPFAEQLGVHWITVSKYEREILPIPRPVALLAETLKAKFQVRPDNSGSIPV